MPLDPERAPGAGAHFTDHFTDDFGVEITYYGWTVEHPRGVVQISHGLGEHAQRYATVAGELNAAGYTVYAADQRGHGATGLAQHGGDRALLGRLGPGGLRATVDDIRQLGIRIAREHPDVPLVLLGHSWGSLMVQKLVNSPALAHYAAVVLSGTAYRMPGSMDAGDLTRNHRPAGAPTSPAAVESTPASDPAGAAAAPKTPTLSGSAVPKNGRVKPGTGFEWLSRDPEAQRRASTDPMMFPAEVLKLFGPLDGLRLYGRPARRLAFDVPILILVGSDDTLGGARSAERLRDAYLHRSGLTDVELHIYPEARHEVLNESNRSEVVADLLAWLSRVLPETE